MTGKRLAQVLCATALLCGSVFAQTTTATLQGTVADPGDAAVPGAIIAIKNVATGVVRDTTSTPEGLFRFNSVIPGAYAMTIKAGTGFKTFTLNDLNLSPNEVRELGRLRLTLGAVTEEVQVTAATTPVQTASSENSKLVDSAQISNITIRGRDLFAILQTVPGVTFGNMFLTQGGASGAGETSSENALQNLQINGGGTGHTNFQVDGIMDVDTGSNSTTHFAPTIDSIAEMRVLTTNYQAEYGRSSGGQIAVVTKGGGQQFHGGGNANKRHEMFNAKNFFQNYNGQTKSQYRYFIWGYNIGGPVYIPKVFNTNKKRVFFFWSQEYTRQKPNPTGGYLNVPNPNQRKGDFSYYTQSNGTFVANSLRNPVTGAYITPSANAGTTGAQNFAQFLPSFDSQSEKWGQAMVNFMPLPNLCNASAGTSDGNPWNGIAAGQAGSNLISPTNCPSSIQNAYLATGNIDTQGGPGTNNNNTRNYYWRALGDHPRRNDTIRTDFNLTSKMTAWARYISDYDMDRTGFTLPLKDSTGAYNPIQIDHPNPGHGWGVGITYAISPTMVNEFTFGKSYNSWSYYLHDDTQFDRALMLNPPSFKNFSTDPNFVNDKDLPRPGLSAGHQNYQVGVPSTSFGGSSWQESSFANTYCSSSCPYTNWNDIYSFNDTVSKVTGKHNLKAGFYYERTGKVEPAQTGTYTGSYNFAGGNTLNQKDTLDGWANAFLGNINQYSEGQRNIGNWWFTQIEAFVQDNWRVSPRVTLDLGVRFYHMPPVENLNKTTPIWIRATYNSAAAERIFYPFCTVSTAASQCPNNTLTTTYQYAWDKGANPSGAIGTGQGGAGNMYPSNLVGTLVPYSFNGLSAGGYTVTSDPFTGMQVADGSNPNVPLSLYTFPAVAPAVRIGFAWDVFGTGKTAIRGGFGQFYDRRNSGSGTNQVQPMLGNPPTAVNKIQNFGSIASIASSPLAGTNPANNLIAGLSPPAPSEIIGRQPYESAYNGSFMIQQNIGFSSVLEVSYVVALRRHVANSVPINNVNQMYNEYQTAWLNPMNAYLDQYLPAGNASGRALSQNYFRPIQGYGGMTETRNLNSTDYNALQVTLRRNFTKSFSYGVSYNFSKLMSGSNRGFIFPDKYRDWGPSYQPTPHVITINYVYDAPKIAERLGFKPLAWVTDGWQISGLTQIRSNLMTGYPSFGFANTNSTTLVTPNTTGTTAEGSRVIVLGSPLLVDHEVSFKGGPTTASATTLGVNGTPGNAIFNNASVMAPYPCSLTPQANPRLGVGMNIECFGNAGAGSLFPIPHTRINNWDMTFSKQFPIKGEGRSLEFRAEMYNIWNHTQFTGASTGQSYDWKTYRDTGALVPNSGTTGRYTSASQPRIMSMTLRFRF